MDKSKISVSGVSAGASMATQMHVIYSSHIMGVGMISGGKYSNLLSDSIENVSGKQKKLSLAKKR